MGGRETFDFEARQVDGQSCGQAEAPMLTAGDVPHVSVPWAATPPLALARGGLRFRQGRSLQ